MPNRVIEAIKLLTSDTIVDKIKEMVSKEDVEYIIENIGRVADRRNVAVSQLKKLNRQEKSKDLAAIKSRVSRILSVDDVISGNLYPDSYDLLYRGAICSLYLKSGVMSLNLDICEDVCCTAFAPFLEDQIDKIKEKYIARGNRFFYPIGEIYTEPDKKLSEQGLKEINYAKPNWIISLLRYSMGHPTNCRKSPLAAIGMDIEENVDDYVLVSYATKITILKLADIKDKIKVSLR